jgi:hypothetical protein
MASSDSTRTSIGPEKQFSPGDRSPLWRPQSPKIDQQSMFWCFQTGLRYLWGPGFSPSAKTCSEVQWPNRKSALRKGREKRKLRKLGERAIMNMLGARRGPGVRRPSSASLHFLCSEATSLTQNLNRFESASFRICPRRPGVPAVQLEINVQIPALASLSLVVQTLRYPMVYCKISLNSHAILYNYVARYGRVRLPRVSYVRTRIGVASLTWSHSRSAGKRSSNRFATPSRGPSGHW